MNTKTQLVCAFSGVLFVTLITIGWILLAGLVPPHTPTMDAGAVAAFYNLDTGYVRFGLLLAMFSASLSIPWIAVIALYMQRMEGNFPVLTYTQIVAGAATIFALTLPFVIWTVAAFRPERAPELIQLMNDFGWILLIMTFPMFFIQLVAIGFAVLNDPGAEPVFPRWTGYFNIWVAILFIPGGLLTFFKTGPFAWDGLLAFWLPLTVFFVWYLAMFVVLVKAIRRAAAA